MENDDDEIEYLPEPPRSRDEGAVGTAPSAEYVWVPGTWYWEDSYEMPTGGDFVYDRGSGFELRINVGQHHDRGYAWRPGYWMRARRDRLWVTAHYIWSPRGYVFVDGHWDFPFEQRGLLFAPVRFERPAVARTIHYTPTIALDLEVVRDGLFIGPHQRRYYFGDYYAVEYVNRGYHPLFEAEIHHGYDPIFAYSRWRLGAEWVTRVHHDYDFRREHVDSRPARTYLLQSRQVTRAEPDRRVVTIARPVREYAAIRTAGIELHKLAPERRQTLVQRGVELNGFRDRRASLEITGAREVRAPEDRPTVTRERPDRDREKETKTREPRDAREREPRDARDREVKDRPQERVAGDTGARKDTVSRDAAPGRSAAKPADRVKIERSPVRSQARERPVKDAKEKDDDNDDKKTRTPEPRRVRRVPREKDQNP